MPHRAVSFATGQYYHVYNRGADRQPIFFEAENYPFLIGLFKKYAPELQIAVIVYCLMPNHYHLLLRQDGETAAGKLPGAAFNSYTKAVNKRYERTGTLFEGRYKAVHVERDEHLLHLCRYIHGNPAKAGLVTQVEAWPYSNYPEWTGARQGTLVDREFARERFVSGTAYARFVAEYLSGRVEMPTGVEGYLLD